MEKLIIKQSYALRIDNNGLLTFIKNGKDFFSVPASASLNGRFSKLNLKSVTTNLVTYSSDKEVMTVELRDDCAVVRYTKKFDEETQIYKSKIFTDGKSAMDLKGFDRAFCPQPRNNAGKNMDYFHHFPDISANGYFTPPALQFSLGSEGGWVSLGLLDIPDTKICRLEEDFSFLIESCGGNKVIPTGEWYCMPRVMIQFPQNEWEAITMFREKLEELGIYKPQKMAFSEVPGWWKNPFVCTYGDQLIEHKVGQLIDEQWINDLIAIVETEWGMKEVNLIIDDSWQLPHSMEPTADQTRFPDLRRMIDRLHERGHHVLLWLTPLFDKITNGFMTKAQKLGVISGYEYAPPVFGTYFSAFPGCYAIDYTADNAELFVKEVAEMLFGDGPGQFNADGVKLDFLGTLRDPAVTQTYAHPEKGIGLKELYRFYEMFHNAAKSVKKDAIIDATVGDPRFEHLIDFNRLHDTHCGTIEKEIRAELALRGCPNLLVDSDGALMFKEWLKTHYISVAVYGVPSNYYSKQYHNLYVSENGEFGSCRTETTVEIDHMMKKQLAALFQMTQYKPDGMPQMDSFGNWLLKEGQRINAISQKGETVVYYPTEKNEKGYIFTWQDEVIMVPLHGRKFSGLTPEPKNDFLMVDYARDIVITRLTPGVMHTFVNMDDGMSIDRKLKDGITLRTEVDMNYVNG